MVEDIRDLLVVQNWQPRFHDPIKPADRIGRNTACTLSDGRFIGLNQSWRYARRIRTATTTLADVIRRNTAIDTEISDDVCDVN